MTLEILDEVAFLFVEQFDNLYGMLVDRTDVKRMTKISEWARSAVARFAASHCRRLSAAFRERRRQSWYDEEDKTC